MAPSDQEAGRADRQHLELVTEVRALTIAVGQLHTIFVKRRVLFWCIGALAVLVLITSGTSAYVQHSSAIRIDTLISKLTDNCHTRNTQVNGTSHFIQRIQDLQSRQLKHIPAQFRTPEQHRLAQDYQDALTQWKKSQPKAVPCTLK